MLRLLGILAIGNWLFGTHHRQTLRRGLLFGAFLGFLAHNDFDMVNRYNSIYKVELPNITPHVCRHTYCSNMARKGMNPKTLQYLMGHSDISVTMNTYTHLGLDDACEELHRMGEIERARAEQERMDGEDNGEAGMMAI